jgi:hypothetical protein
LNQIISNKLVTRNKQEPLFVQHTLSTLSLDHHSFFITIVYKTPGEQTIDDVLLENIVIRVTAKQPPVQQKRLLLFLHLLWAGP